MNNGVPAVSVPPPFGERTVIAGVDVGEFGTVTFTLTILLAPSVVDTWSEYTPEVVMLKSDGVKGMTIAPVFSPTVFVIYEESNVWVFPLMLTVFDTALNLTPSMTYPLFVELGSL